MTGAMFTLIGFVPPGFSDVPSGVVLVRGADASALCLAGAADRGPEGARAIGHAAEAVRRAGSTILPVRHAPPQTEAVIGAILANDGKRIAAGLAKLDGMVEVAVRIVGNGYEAAAVSGGRDYLLAKRYGVTVVPLKLRAKVVAMHLGASAAARAAWVAPYLKPPSIFASAYLVPQGDSLVETHLRSCVPHIEGASVVGPQVPWRFAEQALEGVALP